MFKEFSKEASTNFKIEKQYKTFHLEINIFDIPYYNEKDCFFFGFPYNLNEILSIELPEIGNSLKGYWSRFIIREDSIEITQDIVGGYRLYYASVDNQTIISNNYQYIIDNLNLEVKIDDLEFEYWKKHRYTTGSRTFIEKLHKIPPASIWTFNDKGIQISSYFKELNRVSNASKHTEKIDIDLSSTFKNILQLKIKVILFFSGGKDSTLLLKYLIDYNIDFDLVYFQMLPESVFGTVEKNRAINTATSFNREVKIINIDVENVDNDLINEIVKLQLFDRHFSMLHYLGLKKLKELYDKQVILVNGQSSDSILSFGPSEETVKSLLRRLMLYYPQNIIAKIGVLLANKTLKIHLRTPKTQLENFLALYDESKYIRAIDLNKKSNYYDFLTKKIKPIILNHISIETIDMLIKINTFLQGSDNQVVINSAKHNGFNKLIMPFATPEIIYSTILYKDNWKEIWQPKYVIKKLTPKVKSDKTKLNIIEIKENKGLSSNVYDKFDNYFYNSINNPD